MKKIKNVLLPLSLVAIFSMTSCDKGLVRVKYKNQIDRVAAQTSLSKIRDNQFVDSTTKKDFNLFNAGTVSYKYSITVTGDIRLDKSYTLDNVNLHTDGYVNFAWDLEKMYFKTDGPKEVRHIFKDADGNLWEADDYQRGKERRKTKYDFSKDDVFNEYKQNFPNYLVKHEAIYDLSTGIYLDPIPLIGSYSLIYGTGLTGFANEYYAESQEGVLTPHKIFASKEYDDFFAKLHEHYDNSKDGHYFTEEYTEDGNNLTCAAKGDIDLSVYDEIWSGEFWYLSGPTTFDTFTAWEDNFIRQSVFHLNAHVIESQISEWNLTFKVDIEQNVTKGCKIETVDLTKYEMAGE